MKESHYRDLGIMAALSFLAMYILMYAMVDGVNDIYMNINQVNMAGLMSAPMVVIELLVMRGMHHNARQNAVVIAVARCHRSGDVHGNPATNSRRRRAVPPVDDSAPLRSDTDVR
jgi:hypothetical protein